jgi:hypothetical protein
MIPLSQPSRLFPPKEYTKQNTPHNRVQTCQAYEIKIKPHITQKKAAYKIFKLLLTWVTLFEPVRVRNPQKPSRSRRRVRTQTLSRNPSGYETSKRCRGSRRRGTKISKRHRGTRRRVRNSKRRREPS